MFRKIQTVKQNPKTIVENQLKFTANLPSDDTEFQVTIAWIFENSPPDYNNV